MPRSTRPWATPLGGTTLLHMCVDYDELEIARWLLSKGMDVNIRSRVGASGYGGYTPLFNTVVSQPNFWMNYNHRGPFTAPFAELLLEHGADPNVRSRDEQKAEEVEARLRSPLMMMETKQVGEAGAGEVRIGVAAVDAMGIHDGRRSREHLVEGLHPEGVEDDLDAGDVGPGDGAERLGGGGADDGQFENSPG